MKISIITPCYNSEKTIEDTLKSVLAQNYENYEYIVVDGKSQDNTLKIVDKYKKKFKGKLTIISEKDKSLFDAMNKGIINATGEIIGIINSDDVLAHDSVFEKVVMEMKNKDVSVVYSDLLFYNEDLSKVVRVFKTGNGSVFRGWHPPHPTLYLKKEVYNDLGLFNLNFKISADLDLMIKIFKSKKYKFSYVKDNFVKMRVGGVSTDGLKGYVRNFKEAIKVYKSNNIKFPYLINIWRSVKTIYQILKSKFIKNK